MSQQLGTFAYHRQREHAWCYGLTGKVAFIDRMAFEHQYVELAAAILRFNLI